MPALLLGGMVTCGESGLVLGAPATAGVCVSEAEETVVEVLEVEEKEAKVEEDSVESFREMGGCLGVAFRSSLAVSESWLWSSASSTWSPASEVE